MSKKKKYRFINAIIFVVLLIVPLVHWLYCRIFGFPVLLKTWNETFENNYPTVYYSILIGTFIFFVIGVWGIYKKKKIGFIFGSICLGYMWVILIIRIVSLLNI